MFKHTAFSPAQESTYSLILYLRWVFPLPLCSCYLSGVVVFPLSFVGPLDGPLAQASDPYPYGWTCAAFII